MGGSSCEPSRGDPVNLLSMTSQQIIHKTFLIHKHIKSLAFMMSQ